METESSYTTCRYEEKLSLGRSFYYGQTKNQQLCNDSHAGWNTAGWGGGKVKHTIIEF